MRGRSSKALLLASMVAGCSSSADEHATLLLERGAETDAFVADPAPTTLKVVATVNGSASTVYEGAFAGGFSVADLPESGAATFAAELRASTGQVVLRGETPLLDLASLDGQTIPLLCGRTGQLAELDASFAVGAVTPTLLDGRAVLVSDDDGYVPYAFDFGTLATTDGPTSLDSTSLIAAVVGTSVVALDGESARLVDVSTGSSADLGLDPTTAAELSFGRFVATPAGVAIVAGAGFQASTAVLLVDTSGSPTVLALPAPRQNAAIGYVPSLGLVIAGGGSDTVDVLADGASSFATLASIPPRDRPVIVADTSEVVLVGGGGPTLHVPFSCGNSCVPTVDATDPIDVARGASFPFGAGQTLVIGESASDGTVALRIALGQTPLQPQDVPLRVPRHEGAGLALGDGYVLIVGGVQDEDFREPTPQIEIFTPP